MKGNIDSLVQRAQHGDIRAFEKLVEFFQDAVFGAAYAIAQNFHDAEEIAQEAFVLAYQELPRLREPEKFLGWLRRLTTTACSRYLRSRKAACQDLSTALDVPADLPGQDVVVETKELKEHILREINALSEKNRLVTVLYFIDGYSHKEISDFLEAPVSTVKNRLHRSRKTLQGRLMRVAEEVLHENKPGAEFVQRLKEKLNGQIIELPDGRVQVFYDFVDEKQLEDWRIGKPSKAEAKVRDGGLVFGRVEPEETDKQWDRSIRLNLVFDPNPETDLEIEYDVIMGTSEPWCDVVWTMSNREGVGHYFHGGLAAFSDEWREKRGEQLIFEEGYVRADFLMRCDRKPEEMRWLAPTMPVRIIKPYHMTIRRHDRYLRWQVSGQTIGEVQLADDELCLTERLYLVNHGKGSGAVYKNVVIRSHMLEVDPSWPDADPEESIE
jgi:RNA polymerase sigma-70 factor (ECF subfamily)